jgi:O-antigen ligase
MGVAFKRFVVPYVVGLAPAVLMFAGSSPSGVWSPSQQIMRSYALPVVAAELFVIAVAILEGMVRELPAWKWSRSAVAASVILAAIAVMTAFLAPASDIALILTFYWIVHALFALSIFFLCGTVCRPGDFIRAYLLGFAIFAIQFLVFVHEVPDWSRFDWKSGFMAFGHVRHAGYYLAAMAALGMGTMAVTKGKGEWLFAFACAAGATGIALWTGSRGAALAIGGALFFAALIVPAVKTLRGLGGGIAAAVTGVALVAITPSVPHYLMGLTRTVQQTSSDDVTTGRTIIWHNVIGAIRHRPLFGYGEGQMHQVAPFSTMVQPHDSILQVTLAWGLAGLLCIAVLLALYARRAFPAIRSSSAIAVPPFMAGTAIAILSLYDGALYYALPQCIFAACAAIVASQWGGAAATVSTPRDAASDRAP